MGPAQQDYRLFCDVHLASQTSTLLWPGAPQVRDHDSSPSCRDQERARPSVRTGGWMGLPCSLGLALSCVKVSAEKKLTGSTVGMQTSVETSALLKVRPVPGRGSPGGPCTCSHLSSSALILLPSHLCSHLEAEPRAPHSL
jgi:hypothetical protein